MAGAHIKFETDYIEFDDGGAIAALERLRYIGGNQEAVFKDIGEYLIIRTEERFDREVGPGGVAWQDVTPETRKRKKHPKILSETLRLRGSFSYAASADELLFGTNVIYAAIHQFGGTIERAAYSRLSDRAEVSAGSAEIPARPFLGFDDEDEQEIYAIVLDHLAEAGDDA